ncbi:MAG TPA: DNA primase [Verrucomicrobiae bacterium]|nr:DNA primase [Verrucomicrobiae bacterium]
MSGFFSQATLDQVRAANDIVEVIGGYIPLKRAGANFVALCPFHKEKTPSFNVNPHLQIFHCFGCHKGGNVFTFVKEFESIDFPEAVRRLAERARIPIETQQNPGEQQSRHLKEKLLQVHEQIAQRWQNALANEASGQIGREYLARRGVSSEAITLFRLGCAPELWDDTVNWAKSKGFDMALVEKAGLILRKEGTDHYYDRFRGRLMFPICDEQGRVIGFSGRVLSGDEKSAKYVNSPETPIFTKSKVFFGLDKSKRALLDAEWALVCEGQLDLISCFMAGIQNVVAPQGTALTAEHARVLKRYVQEVVLCFDSDEAGQNATVRSLDHLLASGLAVRVAVVSSPHDPDSFIKAHGGNAFKEIVQGADGFFDYYLKRLCANNDVKTDKGRLAVLREMAAAVHKTGNNVLIETVAQKTALRLGVSPEAVRREFQKLASSKGALEQKPEEVSLEREPQQQPSTHEFWLLKILLLHEELVSWAAVHLDINWIINPLIKGIVGQRLATHRDGTWTTLASFLAQVPEGGSQNLIAEATACGGPVPNPEQQLADVCSRLRAQSLEKEMAALMYRLSQPEMPEPERIELLRKREALRTLKRTPIGGNADKKTAGVGPAVP